MPPRWVALASGVPTGPVGALGATGGVAPRSLAPGIAEARWLKAGAAEVQPCGTDNTPSVAARPTFAVTAAEPIPDESRTCAPEPQPVLSADPNTWNSLPNALVDDPIEFISGPAEPSIEMPEVDIDADEAVPDTRLVPDVSAVDDDVRVVKDDSGDVEDDDVTVDASPSSALGVATDASGVVIAEVSGDTVCTPVPAEVPAACVTAAASPADPPGLVVCSGIVNAVNVDAADDAPA